jgi:hypothetical protein
MKTLETGIPLNLLLTIEISFLSVKEGATDHQDRCKRRMLKDLIHIFIIEPWIDAY